MPLVEIALLLVALAILSKSTELVINGAIKLADFFRIGQMAIGFLLVSVATSLPELAVSVISGAQAQGGITIGNVFGSNIADILLVLGLTAFFYGIKPRMEEWKEISFIVLAVTILTVVMIYLVGLDKPEGAVLIVLFALYAYYLLRKGVNVDVQNHVSLEEAGHAFVVFSIGITLVLLSAAFTVQLAVSLAESLGFAKSFIGATIIAVGTSLPELAVDIQALRQKKYGLALGDAIGSTMTNLTLVLGVAALLNPIPLRIPIFLVLMAFSILTNMVLVYFISVSKALERKEGAIFLILYLFYLIAIFNAQLQMKEV